MFFHTTRFHSVTSNSKSFSPAATLDPRPRLWTRDRDFGPTTRDPRLLVKLGDGFSRALLRVRPSWSTQILLRHVLNLQTPLPRQRDVTDSFSSIHSFCASCDRFWTYVLPATAGVRCCLFFRFGGSAFCVLPVFFRTRRENFLLLS